MAVPMFPVNSSHLSYVGWEDGVLYITFSRGAKFKYLDVPEQEFKNLRDSHSIGQYFNSNIKDTYTSVKI